MPTDAKTGISYALHGSGVPLFLGFPIMASYGEIFGAANAGVLSGFLDRLTDRYRVLVVDYPSIGKSRSIPPGELTADRVCADLLGVADAAGFDRFAWWGYSWGAQAGLQLASRTDRLSALVVGGWSPLGGPYADILRASEVNVENPPASAMVVLREPAQYAQWVTYNRSVQNWPEASAVARIDCPRLAYAGADADVDPGGVPVRYATALREHRAELERMGWRVVLLPDQGHAVGLEPEIVVPIVREFLDAALPASSGSRAVATDAHG